MFILKDAWAVVLKSVLIVSKNLQTVNAKIMTFVANNEHGQNIER